MSRKAGWGGACPLSPLLAAFRVNWSAFFFDATQTHQGRRPAILHSLVSGKRCDGTSLNGCRLHSCSINLEAGCSQEHYLFSQQKGRLACLFFLPHFFSPMELIFPTSSLLCPTSEISPCMEKKKKICRASFWTPLNPPSLICDFFCDHGRVLLRRDTCEGHQRKGPKDVG